MVVNIVLYQKTKDFLSLSSTLRKIADDLFSAQMILSDLTIVFWNMLPLFETNF